MKNLSSNPNPFYTGLYLGGTLLFSLVLIYTAIPAIFSYNSDINISPIGLALAEGYQELPFSLTNGQAGYINNGIFSVYNHWPPLGFYMLSLWRSIFGNDIIVARLFYLCLQGLNLVLLNLLLHKYKCSLNSRLACLIIVSILPFRLIYSTLIFADLWVLTFWLGALLTYHPKESKKVYLPIFILLFGTGFSWQVFFMIPALVTIHFSDKIKVSNSIVFLFVVVVAISFFELLRYWITDSSPSIFKQLSHYSIATIIHDPLNWGVLTLKKSLKVVLEAFPVFGLYLLNLGVKKKPSPVIQGDIQVLVLTLSFYLVVMPCMFAFHEHQVIIFDLLIILIIIQELGYLKRAKRLLKATLAVLLIGFTIYLGLPYVQYNRTAIEQKELQIAKWINEEKVNANDHICLFLDIPNLKKGDHQRLYYFAMRYYTNAYLFESIENKVNIEYEIAYKVKHLKQLPIKNTDSNQVFIIAQQQQKLVPKTILAETQVSDLYIYKIDLNEYPK